MKGIDSPPVGPIINRHLLFDYAQITAEPAPPEIMAQNDDVLSPGLVLFGQKTSPDNRLDA